jgi:hypothetical protein
MRQRARRGKAAVPGHADVFLKGPEMIPFTRGLTYFIENFSRAAKGTVYKEG